MTLPSQEVDSQRLRVENLQVRLANTNQDVVDEVSFSVASREVLGLVGESGSGKTTVGLALLGYARRGVEITGGKVVLDGTDILGLDAKALQALRGATVAYVPQDPASALNPALRIGNQLREAMKVHPGAVDDVDLRVPQVLEDASLANDILDRYPHQLSGGQQQRVALAMAFSCRPSLIVLDEPTTGLDVSTQRHVLETVKQLCVTYGVAAVYVSHDLVVVRNLVSEIAVMYAGRIVEQGRTEVVFDSPAHPYTQGLLGAIPSPERAEVLVGISGQPPRPGNRPTGCSFASRCVFRTEVCAVEPPPLPAPTGAVVRCVRVNEILSGPVKSRVRTLAVAREQRDELLAVRNMSARYGDLQVTFDVDITVTRESCVAVVGESGSGKTTLARCIVGLHGNWGGELTLNGEPLQPSSKDRTRRDLQRIRYVFQNPYTSLNPRKNVGQILSQTLDHFTPLTSAERQRRVGAVLDDVSLSSNFLRRYPDELSGGERQRVAIARGLVVDPDVLICDEVTSALDVSVQATIVELLRRLQSERQLSMVFITHNLALVRSIAQSCVVLSEGRVVESGTVEQILSNPEHPYTQRLIRDVPRLEQAGVAER